MATNEPTTSPMDTTPPVESLPDLVLLPGMVCSSASWSPQLVALRDSAVLRVPTYGQAPTFTAMAEVVLQQAPARFALAGHSMGGRVALEVYRLAPSRVERLCLIGTEFRGCPPGVEGERETAGRLKLLQLAQQEGMRAMAKAWLPALLAESRVNDPELSQQIIEMIAGFAPKDLERHILAGASRPDSSAVLSELQCPVLLIGGSDDRIRPLTVLQEMASRIRNCRLIGLGGCGHMPMLERPEQVNDALRAWLS